MFQRNLPNVWQNAEHFFDLSDFLTWKATKGLSENRSLCSLVCKWTYDGVPEAGWSESYFKEIGLEDVDFKKIGLPDQVYITFQQDSVLQNLEMGMYRGF